MPWLSPELLVYHIVLYCILTVLHCMSINLEIAPCSVRPKSRTSTGKEELCIFVLVIFVTVIIPAFIHFCYHFTFLSSHLLWYF